MASMPMSRSAMPHRSDAGFTLVELLVVLAIIAGLAVMASMSISSLSTSWALRNSAYDLRGFIVEARGNAIRDGETVNLGWREGAWMLETSSASRQMRGDRRLDVSFRPAFSGDEPLFSMFPDGTSTGGTFRLAMAGHSIEIATDWLTGVPTVAWSENANR